MTVPVGVRYRWIAERRFYTGMTLIMLASVLVGFARTFFLKPWFPEVAHLAPPEPFFLVHGISFTLWMLLLVAQPILIARRRVDLHRVVGWFGAGLAAVVVAVGTYGSLIAAARPGGFIGVSVPPLQFLVVPLADLVLFAVFVALAVVLRRDTASHKRFMLVATIGLLDAAIIRMPFGNMTAAVAGSTFTRTDLIVDLFLVPLVIWDIKSRGRVHKATTIGAISVIASQPLRLMVSETGGWLRFAEWAVGLV